MKSYTTRRTCRLCHSTDLELALPLKPTPIGDNYLTGEQLASYEEIFNLDVYHCCNCGQVQLRDVVEPRLLYPDFPYTTSISVGLPEHFRRFAESVIEEFDIPVGSLVMEIGSNEGPMLRAFKEKGCRVLGIEPAKDIAKAATASGIHTLPEFFHAKLADKLVAEFGKARVIAANNVLANIDDLDDVFVGFARCLDEDGLVVMETSYWRDVVQKNLIDTIYHEHISYFSVKPLERFGSRHGFELIRVVRNSNKGGSIRLIFQRKCGKYQADESVGREIAGELQEGIFTNAAFELCRRALDDNRTAIARWADLHERSGVHLRGYGASVGTTTQIYEYDLGERITQLIDDNPRKKGRFSPGYRIPCVDAECEALKSTPLVLFAWRYLDQIRKKRPSFGKDTEVLIPLPKVEIQSGSNR